MVADLRKIISKFTCWKLSSSDSYASSCTEGVTIYPNLSENAKGLWATLKNNYFIFLIPTSASAIGEIGKIVLAPTFKMNKSDSDSAR